MESGSRTDTSPEQTSHKLADFIGTLIALLTLVLPIMTIAYYSSLESPDFFSPPTNSQK